MTLSPKNHMSAFACTFFNGLDKLQHSMSASVCLLVIHVTSLVYKVDNRQCKQAHNCSNLGFVFVSNLIYASSWTWMHCYLALLRGPMTAIALIAVAAQPGPTQQPVPPPEPSIHHPTALQTGPLVSAGSEKHHQLLRMVESHQSFCSPLGVAQCCIGCCLWLGTLSGSDDCQGRGQ